MVAAVLLGIVEVAAIKTLQVGQKAWETIGLALSAAVVHTPKRKDRISQVEYVGRSGRGPATR